MAELGRRDRFKLCCPKGRVGSIPTMGTFMTKKLKPKQKEALKQSIINACPCDCHTSGAFDTHWDSGCCEYAQ